MKPGGLEKKYLKQGSVCKVTFVLPKAAAPDAGSVCILGEFNNWSADAHPLVRREEGDFAITLELEAGRAYRFRYVIDGWKFENDWFADRYEPNPYGGEDSCTCTTSIAPDPLRLRAYNVRLACVLHGLWPSPISEPRLSLTR